MFILFTIQSYLSISQWIRFWVHSLTHILDPWLITTLCAINLLQLKSDFEPKLLSLSSFLAPLQKPPFIPKSPQTHPSAVSAVHDGYILNKSVIRSPLSGHLLTKCMQHAIEAKGTQVHPRYAFKRRETAPGQFEVDHLDFPGTTDSYKAFQVESICQDIKHTICRVSDTPFDPEENANIPTVSYELPDGQEIHVGADRFTVPEILFNPSLLSAFGDIGKTWIKHAGGVDTMVGLSASVTDSINRCDVDVRRELYNGIVLTGGTSLFASLRDRLEKELTESAPTMMKVKVVAPINAIERRYSVWIGGSILSSLGTFQQMWMSKAEYKEHGAGLIHKKAP